MRDVKKPHAAEVLKTLEDIPSHPVFLWTGLTCDLRSRTVQSCCIGGVGERNAGDRTLPALLLFFFFFCTLEEHKVLCDVFAFHPGESNSPLLSVTLHFSHYSRLFLILTYTFSAPHRRDDSLSSPKSHNRENNQEEKVGLNRRRSPWGHALSLKCDTLAERIRTIRSVPWPHPS